jgi:DNA-binding transcriptional LysR family regulator
MSRQEFGSFQRRNEDIGIRHLEMLALLLEEGSLTAAAQLLGIGQPSVSKSLRKLRAYFRDPLLVRVGQQMHPTPRASALRGPLRDLLGLSRALAEPVGEFDPSSSPREFRILVSEAGMIVHVPVLADDLAAAGPHLLLKAIPLDSRAIASKLEAGDADVGLGSFSEVPSSLKRQKLYTDTYAAIVRAGHPRLKYLRSAGTFLRERHVLVIGSTVGHAAHGQLEDALRTELKHDRIMTSMPSFLTAAFLVSRTDAVSIVPKRVATQISDQLGLRIFNPPISLPKVEIAQVWHERVHSESGHRWFRSRIRALFR